MIRALLVSLALLASQAPSVRAQSATPLPHFSITVESRPTGWAARCDSGCKWTQLSFECARGCGAVIDASGASPIGASRPDSAAFAFTVQHDTAGVRARSRAGTAWKTLTWDCGANSCAAHVDEFGVSEIRSSNR
jgi:hypothetical protein